MPSRIFTGGLLEGQVVLVAGADTAVGRASAAELSACGAEVVALDCAPADESAVDARVEAVVERHGRIDTLVNCGAPGGTAGTQDAFAGFNPRGVWLPTHAVATKAMIPAGGGRIVNVAAPDGGDAPAPVRAAVENLTRVLSIEWARHGIHLNAVAGVRDPEQHAWLVAYLASPAGAYFSGSVLTGDSLAAAGR